MAASNQAPSDLRGGGVSVGTSWTLLEDFNDLFRKDGCLQEFDTRSCTWTPETKHQIEVVGVFFAFFFEACFFECYPHADQSQPALAGTCTPRSWPAGCCSSQATMRTGSWGWETWWSGRRSKCCRPAPHPLSDPQP